MAFQEETPKPMALEEKVIEFLVERILHYEFDYLIEYTVHTEPPEHKDELLHIDKFYVYRLIWRGTLENLYKKYLPEVEYTCKWEIELSPYTLSLCNILKDEEYIDTQRKVLREKFNIRDENLLSENKKWFTNLGLNVEAFSDTLKKRLPADELERYLFLYRIMNFPPLEELAHFYHLVYSKSTNALKALIPIFAPKNPEYKALPPFRLLEPLNNSVFPISHKLFTKYGLDYLESLPELTEFKSDFVSIRTKAAANKDKFTGTFICSCCGELHTTAVPIALLEYKCFVEKTILAKEVGYLLLNEVENDYMTTIGNAVSNFLQHLNSVEHPDIIILVEGASEETSIPLLAFRKRFSLLENKVFIHNSGSKQKLQHDFLSIRNKYPNQKIISVLDGDAVKEKNDIERIVNKNRHQYELVFIEKGTWEDLFPLDFSIQILNEMYPDGEVITSDDFNPNKDFLTNIKSFFFKKKLADFDKVEFAKTVSLKMNIEALPDVINEIFTKAEKFAASKDSIFQASSKK